MMIQIKGLEIFNKLDLKKIDYLSRAEESQAKLIDYLPNEIIISEGTKYMNEFYIVV